MIKIAAISLLSGIISAELCHLIVPALDSQDVRKYIWFGLQVAFVVFTVLSVIKDTFL